MTKTQIKGDWQFVPSHDVGNNAVPEYWQNEETGERFYSDEPPTTLVVWKACLEYAICK